MEAPTAARRSSIRMAAPGVSGITAHAPPRTRYSMRKLRRPVRTRILPRGAPDQPLDEFLCQVSSGLAGVSVEERPECDLGDRVVEDPRAHCSPPSAIIRSTNSTALICRRSRVGASASPAASLAASPAAAQAAPQAASPAAALAASTAATLAAPQAAALAATLAAPQAAALAAAQAATLAATLAASTVLRAA